MRGIVLIAGLLVAAVSASVATGQAPNAGGIESCKLIKDNLARLRCFDQAASAPQPAIPPAAQPQLPAAQPEPPAKSKSGWLDFFNLDALLRNVAPSSTTPSPVAPQAPWQVRADKSPINEASEISGALQSADREAMLVLRCKDKNIEAYVETHSFLGWETMRVRYRIDNNPVVESRWAVSPDGRSAVASSLIALPFINSLLDKATLLVNVIDYDGRNHESRFILDSVSDIRSQIFLVCNRQIAADEIISYPQQINPKQNTRTPTRGPLILQ